MFEVRKTTIGPLPNVPYEKIAHAVLGARFELSLVICGDSLATTMNKKYRQKSYSPNVLSFPLSKEEGEIFLNIRKIARESKQFNIELSDRLAHLFIHGCLHLKGLDHGDAMERRETRLLKKFGFHAPENWPEV